MAASAPGPPEATASAPQERNGPRACRGGRAPTRLNQAWFTSRTVRPITTAASNVPDRTGPGSSQAADGVPQDPIVFRFCFPFRGLTSAHHQRRSRLAQRRLVHALLDSWLRCPSYTNPIRLDDPKLMVGPRRERYRKSSQPYEEARQPRSVGFRRASRACANSTLEAGGPVLARGLPHKPEQPECLRP